MLRATSRTTRAWPNGPESGREGWQVFGSWARITRVQPDATLPPDVATDPPQTTEPPRQRGGLFWWLIVGCVTVAAIVVAGVVLALQPSAPASVDELRSLLITPTGTTTDVTGGRAGDSKAAGPGVRWTVGRTWVDTGHLNAGVVTLT